jgi:N-acetylglucosamine kinase-like BadF-type ATPase
MRETLLPLGIRDIEVVTDADIALYGATDGAPGLVVIAGTGSICCGINARGKQLCAGGWGPIAGDEGAGAWIARRALRAIAYASDGRGPQTLLTEFACNYFHVSTADDLTTAIYAPTITNERIAGFGKDVVEAAKRKDEVAAQIILEGGTELGPGRSCRNSKPADGEGAFSNCLCGWSVSGSRRDDSQTSPC